MGNWEKALRQLPGAVDVKRDAYDPKNCLYTPSPSVNYMFANKAHGIPKGTGVLFYGRNKSGKSLMIQAAIAEMHRRDPEGIAIVYNTEMRGFLQTGSFMGVDPARVIIYDTNNPEEIFVVFERDIGAMINDGMPLRIVAVDSFNSIGGTKSLVEDRSVNDHLMGDKAITIQRGLEKMVPILKRNNIVFFGTAQMRDNFDAGPYGPKEKAGVTWAVKHTFEYMVSVRKSNDKDDKVDLSGNKFEDEEMKDARGNKDITGHKIVLKMEESSCGTPGRSAFVTLDYTHGIINIEEEIFELCKGCGIIENVGAGGYVLYGEKIRGKAEVAKRIKDSPELQQKLLADLKALDVEAV